MGQQNNEANEAYFTEVCIIVSLFECGLLNILFRCLFLVRVDSHVWRHTAHLVGRHDTF